MAEAASKVEDSLPVKALNILSKPVKLVLEKTAEYLEGDSRSLGYLDSTTKARYINIPTPAWYPESFLRSLKSSFYLKMINNTKYRNGEDDNPNKTKLEFYNTNNKSDGSFTGMLKSAVKSLVSVGVNQVRSITSKIDGAISGINTLINGNSSSSSGSAYESIAANQKIPFLAAQPYLEIRGIHVMESLKAGSDILNGTLSCIDSSLNALTDLLTGDVDFGTLFSDTNEKLKKAFIDTFLDKSQRMTITGKDRETSWTSIIGSIFDEKYRMHSVAEKLIQQSVAGRYTMMCKVPLIYNDAVVIQSTGSEGFKRGAIGYQLKGSSGDGKNAAQKLLADVTQDLNVGLSEMIKWIYDVNGASYTMTPVKTKFTIYNDTFEHFLTNYTFIIGFMATTKAVTDGFLVRAPYLYDIIIPGGMRYMLCTCNASIKNVGNIRMLSANTDSIAKQFNEGLGVPLNCDAIRYIPDAYEVSLEFKSVLPDLWNFIDSYINMNTKSNDKRPHIGQEISSTLATFVKTLAEPKKQEDADKAAAALKAKAQEESGKVKAETENTNAKLDAAMQAYDVGGIQKYVKIAYGN